MPQITVTFQMGKVNIDAVGFKGASCIEATEFLKKLGQTTTDYEYKASYYESSINQYGECHTDNLCG